MRRPLNENLFAIGAFAATAFVLVSAWDAQEFERATEEAKVAALKIVVENSVRPEHFASEFHCRAPVKGERLVMQHASAHEPGKGYRCTYWIMIPRGPGPHFATINWSRSPDVELEGYARSVR